MFSAETAIHEFGSNITHEFGHMFVSFRVSVPGQFRDDFGFSINCVHRECKRPHKFEKFKNFKSL